MGVDLPGNEARWYALYTRSRHEKKVELQLLQKGIECYLPLRYTWRQWSDRRKLIQEPLFRCYVFVYGDERQRLAALQTYGAVRFVSFNGRPAVVREEEIENIRRILRERPEAEACEPWVVGEVVEIVRGPLAGIRGTLLEIRGSRRLVVSIDSIRQGVRFEVDGSDVRSLGSSPASARFVLASAGGIEYRKRVH
ncbi:MAG: UpxY family transcription antiterminator [candidate division KSB1 bacterium]|nr:UpxY family transcription antiterminator [candidate division KSB1 bacterium]